MNPVAVASPRLDRLASFCSSGQKDQAAEWFSTDGCMVNYARIGNSPFVVMVEQPYPWPLNLLLRPALGWVLGLILILACLCSVARRAYT
jgi:hypothetical protein